uniref:Uncharacterized protein n=1 Tax=Lepeophtheirus salmonis TaxID=72036 RepID=A0A0K2TCX4_LEPSM
MDVHPMKIAPIKNNIPTTSATTHHIARDLAFSLYFVITHPDVIIPMAEEIKLEAPPASPDEDELLRKLNFINLGKKVINPINPNRNAMFEHRLNM